MRWWWCWEWYWDEMMLMLRMTLRWDNVNVCDDVCCVCALGVQWPSCVEASFMMMNQVYSSSFDDDKDDDKKPKKMISRLSQQVQDQD